MAVPVSIVGSRDGEVVLSDGRSRVRVLEDGRTTAHRLGIIEIVLGPRGEGPPQHRHAEHDEGFYVVAGTVRFTVGADTHDVGPGTLVMVPTGAPHTFANPTDEEAVIISTVTPDHYVQYFRDLRNLATQDGGGREGIANVMRTYATEVSSEYAES